MSIKAGGTERRRGEEAVADELKPKPEKKFDPTVYSCEILLEKTTLEKSNDKSFPTDAFNVTYIVDGETHLDVTRSGKMVNVFDMYCDRYGKTSVQKIDFGFGSVNPTQYGYKSPEKKKRRKG